MPFQYGFDQVRRYGPDENGAVRGTNRYVLPVGTKGSSCAIEAHFEAVGTVETKVRVYRCV